MDFFSKRLTSSDYKKLETRCCILIPDRKIESILNTPDFWIVVFQQQNKCITYATQNPLKMFFMLLGWDKAYQGFENLAGVLSNENLDEDFNKMISNLMITSNVIIHQRYYTDKSGMQAWSSPETKITTLKDYKDFLSKSFEAFNQEVENKYA